MKLTHRNFNKMQVYWDRKPKCHIIDDKFVCINTEGNYVKYNALKDFYAIPDERVYIKMANINPASTDEILSFYDEYGFLDTRLESYQSISPEDQFNYGREDVTKIIKEIRIIRQVLDIYAYILSADEVKSPLTHMDIYRYILNMNFNNFEESTYLSLIWEIQLQSIFPQYESDTNEDIKKRSTPTSIQLMPKKQLLDCLRNILCAMVNKKLGSPSFQLKVENNQIIQEFHCSSLVSIMFLQLYIDISNDRIVKKCANSNCGKYFVVRPSKGNKKYCCWNCAHAQNQRDIYKAKNP